MVNSPIYKMITNNNREESSATQKINGDAKTKMKVAEVELTDKRRNSNVIDKARLIAQLALSI